MDNIIAPDPKASIGPKSLRMSDETKKRLNTIAGELGLNQDGTLNKLISLFEIENAKQIVPKRRTELESLNAHLDAIAKLYIGSIQLSVDAEARISAAFENTLESNQKVIKGLQVKIEELSDSLKINQKLVSEASAKAEELKKENQRLSSEIAKTEELYREYKEKNDTLSGLLVEYQEYKEENKKLILKQKEDAATLTELELQKADLLAKAAAAENKLKQQQEAAANDLDMHDKLAAAKEKEAILTLKETYGGEIEKIKANYQKKLETANEDYRKLLDELHSLRKN